jgi:Methyltransferase domain
MNCLICAHTADILGTATVLGKHITRYFHCKNCGFVFPAQPTWLDEAYSDAITSSDIGLVDRNIVFKQKTAAIISRCFNANAKFIDYGGGYGMFVRLMRDAGFGFYRQDKFCANLFAKHFDADEQGHGQYELLTAFEVFEHLTDPLAEIQKMLTYSSNILFSTLLVPQPPPAFDQWWYYGLEHGQHVALYSLRSLQVIAKRFGLHFCSNSSNLHLLSQNPVSPTAFKLLTRGKVARLVNQLSPRPSLLPVDYHNLTGQHIA